MRAGIRSLLLAGLLAAAAFAVAPPAEGYIYWANGTNGGTTIGRANNDGSGVNPNLITGQKEPCGVAVDSQHIYWANAAGPSIGRANLDGSGVNPNFITSQVILPCGVALEGSRIWWANGRTSDIQTGQIAHANLDGSAPTVMYQGSAFVDSSRGVGANTTYVYWSNFFNPPSIGRGGVDGTPPPNKNFLPLPDSYGPSWPTVGGNRLYFATLFGLVSTDLDGADLKSIFSGATGGIAVSGGKVFWASSTEGIVSRANLDLSSPEFAFASGLGPITGLAVDGGTPSNAFTAKLKGRKLLVTVQAPGTVSVSDAAAGGKASVAARKPRLLKPSSGSGAPPTIVVKLKLTKAASQALRSAGKVKIRARITFTPEGASANTRTSKLKLKSKGK